LTRSALYRPRDVLALLNSAWQNACRARREHIIVDDVESAAKAISQTRLDDLRKEYRRVLPGIDEFVNIFHGAHSQPMYVEVLDLIERASESLSSDAAQSYEIFGGPAGVFLALFSVGFVGVRTASGDYEFCHDGATSGLDGLGPDCRVAVHPCFWHAMDLQDADLPVEVAVLVHDDFDTATGQGAVHDQRLRQLGKVLVDYDQINAGPEHASKFEEWVHRAICVLFAGELTNITLHPNVNAAQRRDIVATNSTNSGFWKRLFDDYRCRHVVFEVKNYEDLDTADFNQAVAYGGDRYGKVSFIVHRGATGLDPNDRAHIKSRYFGTQHLIVLLPASTLLLCLKKQRSVRRADYSEETLARLLDTYERQYLGVDSGKKHARRRRAKKAIAN